MRTTYLKIVNLFYRPFIKTFGCVILKEIEKNIGVLALLFNITTNFGGYVCLSKSFFVKILPKEG